MRVWSNTFVFIFRIDFVIAVMQEHKGIEVLHSRRWKRLANHDASHSMFGCVNYFGDSSDFWSHCILFLESKYKDTEKRYSLKLCFVVLKFNRTTCKTKLIAHSMFSILQMKVHNFAHSFQAVLMKKNQFGDLRLIQHHLTCKRLFVSGMERINIHSPYQ